MAPGGGAVARSPQQRVEARVLECKGKIRANMRELQVLRDERRVDGEFKATERGGLVMVIALG